MTKQEAKELALEVWRYMAEHPEIEYKCDLPKKIYNKIWFMKGGCPLCELFFREKWKGGSPCKGCPLSKENYNCSSPTHPFNRRVTAENYKNHRQEAAREIVRLIEAWEADE